MFILGAITFALLLTILVMGARAWPLARRERPLVVFTLLWVVMVATGHTLSLYNALRDPMAYMMISLMWALFVVWAGGRFFGAKDHQPIVVVAQKNFFAGVPRPQTQKIIFWGAATLLLVAFGISVFIMLAVEPTNADSMSYRLPRIFWYATNGNFLHPFHTFDNRLVFYPLNGILLYLPSVVYGLSSWFYTLPSLLCWLMVVWAVYAFARMLEAPKHWAMLSAALVGLTPPILAQAISTNDEIISAAALLLGLYFLCRWLASGWHGFFALSAMGVGLSIGTKLHIFFYMPVLLIAAVMLAHQAMRHKQKFVQVCRDLWPSGWATALFAIAVLVLPFMMYNLISAGRVYHTDDFAKDFFNLTGNLHVFFQNMLIYTSQIILAPLADLYGSVEDPLRMKFHGQFNKIFGEWIKPLLSNDPSHYHFNYRYNGITLPVSVYFVEYSLWPGFMYLLSPVVLATLAQHRHVTLRRWWLLLALAPVIWFFYWCVTTLYMEGTPNYLSYYIIVAAPAVVFAFGHIAQKIYSRLRWAVVGVVLVTSTIIGFNVFNLNVFRGFQIIEQSPTFPANWEYYSPAVVREIKAASRIKMTFMRWGFSYFSIMRENPYADYLAPNDDTIRADDTTLVIFPILAEHSWGFMPLQIPGKITPGLTMVGTMQAWGTEAVFMAGNKVHERYPDRNNYMVLQVDTEALKKQGVLAVRDVATGYHPADGLQFRYELHLDDQVYFVRDWSHDFSFATKAPEDWAQKKHYILRVFARNGVSKKVLAQFDLKLGSREKWVQDPSAPTRKLKPYQLF